MCMFKMMGLFAVVPTAVLLAISFFVLYAIKRAEMGGLKVFGYVVAAFLWIAALLVFSSGIYSLATGKGAKMCMMREKMHERMERSMQEQMPGMMQHGK